MIKQYRKKPVVIEAVKFDGENGEEVLEFCGNDNARWTSNTSLYIYTLEGDMHVSPGDYIIKGVKGEFYPCKPDIFDATYEEVQ
jgi:hypothetical protein